MAKDLSGSIGKAVIDGVTFDVFSDVDISLQLSRFKSEAVATSGRVMQKRTKIVQELKNLKLVCNEDEAVTLQNKAEGIVDVTLAITLNSGGVVRSAGFLDFEDWSTMDMKASVTFFPRTKWEIFAS